MTEEDKAVTLIMVATVVYGVFYGFSDLPFVALFGVVLALGVIVWTMPRHEEET